MWIRDRLSVWRLTVFWGWWKMGAAVFALVGAYDLVQGQVPTASLPSLERVASWWDWRVWFILALVFGLIGTMEGTYRYVKRLRVTIGELESKLDNKVKRKSIADNLAEFYVSGVKLNQRIIEKEFDEDAMALSKTWAMKVIEYFRKNPYELGESRVLAFIPDDTDLVSMSTPNALDMKDETHYAHLLLRVQLGHLKKVVEEFQNG